LVILFTVTTGIALQLSAQEEYIVETNPLIPLDGYVILSNGETRYGTITCPLKYVENDIVEIKFSAGDGAKKLYNASEIDGFGIRPISWIEGNPVPKTLEMEDYVSLPSYKKGVPVFMKRFIDGMITVYYNRSSLFFFSTFTKKMKFDGIDFSISPNDGLYIKSTFRTDYYTLQKLTCYSSYYVSRNGGPLVKVGKNNYEVLFKTLFGDCAAMDQEIERNPDLMKFKNFIIVAEVYNEICQVESELR
jgi:hypothetical protein